MDLPLLASSRSWLRLCLQWGWWGGIRDSLQSLEACTYGTDASAELEFPPSL